MKVREDLKIKKLIGNKLLVKRFETPKTTESGLFLPVSFVKEKEDVSRKHDLPKYQNRGEVIAIGDLVPEGKYEIGDIVHFQPSFYFLAFLNKEDPKSYTPDVSAFSDNAEVLLDADNGVDWIEKPDVE